MKTLLSQYNKYLEQLKKKKMNTAEAEKLIKNAERAAQMLRRVEEVQIIDSLIVDKASFFKHYKLSSESGTLYDYNTFFNLSSKNSSTVYQNQRGDKILYGAKTGALGFEGYHEMRIALAQANATGVLVNQQEPAPGRRHCYPVRARLSTVHDRHQWHPERPFAAGGGSGCGAAAQRPAGVLHGTGRQHGRRQRDLRPVRLHHQQVPCHRRQPHAGHGGQPDDRAGRGAVRLLLRRYPGPDGDPAHRQGQRRKDHPDHPLRGLPGAKLADIVLLCGAQESPLDSGSIPIKVAVLYVAEVLVLRYILDDKPGSTEAQERTTEALAVKDALSIELKF